MFQIYQKVLDFFGCTPPFLLYNSSLKTTNFQGFFLPLKEPLLASLNETSTLTSPKSSAEKGMNIPKL